MRLTTRPAQIAPALGRLMADHGVWACLVALGAGVLFFLVPLNGSPYLAAGLTTACALMAARQRRLVFSPAGESRLVRAAFAGFALYAGMVWLSSLLNGTLFTHGVVPLWAGCLVSGFIYSRLWPEHGHRHIAAILAGIVVSLAVAAIIGFDDPRLWQGGFRLKLFSWHPAVLALYCVAGVFFCLQAAFWAASKRVRILWLVLAAFFGGLLYLTGVRHAILTLPLGLACLILSLPRAYWRRFGLALLVLGIAAGSATWFSRHDNIRSARLVSASAGIAGERNFLARVRIWEAAWGAIKESPLVGRGTRNFSPVYDAYRERNKQRWDELYPAGTYDILARHEHNTVLARLLESGVPGAAGFFLFYFCGVIAAAQGPPRGRWIVALLVFCLGIGLVDEPLYHRGSYFIIFILGAALGLARPKHSEPDASP
jgi:O-antigen ligase